MQELSKEQIDELRSLFVFYANFAIKCGISMTLAQEDGFIGGVEEILQYAPAPVDGDVIEAMCKAYLEQVSNNPMYYVEHDQATVDARKKSMRAAAQVLQSRHDAELAEYKKALGPVTDEEWQKVPGHYSGQRITNLILANRRALLEKKPEPIDPLQGLTSKYMPETTKAVGLSLHDELIVEAYERGKSSKA